MCRGLLLRAGVERNPGPGFDLEDYDAFDFDDLNADSGCETPSECSAEEPRERHGEHETQDDVELVRLVCVDFLEIKRWEIRNVVRSRAPPEEVRDAQTRLHNARDAIDAEIGNAFSTRPTGRRRVNEKRLSCLELCAELFRLQGLIAGSCCVEKLWCCRLAVSVVEGFLAQQFSLAEICSALDFVDDCRRPRQQIPEALLGHILPQAVVEEDFGLARLFAEGAPNRTRGGRRARRCVE